MFDITEPTEPRLVRGTNVYLQVMASKNAHKQQQSYEISGIQGHLLEVTVVGCNKLKDTEWISRQDPYVCLEYGSTKFRTRTHTDGGKSPKFQEKFIFSLIEGLRELIVVVWNSNTLTYDDFIGSGKVQLHKVLSLGFDDSAWPIQTKTGRHAGEVKLILHYPNANANANKHSSKPTSSYAPSAPPNPQVHSYSATPPTSYPPPASAPSYPPPPSAVPYPPVATVAYPASSPYPPYSSAYPPPPYPPPPAAHPPPPYPPSSGYPPSHYPPPPPSSGHYPPGPYPGMYPPPPY